jgi:multiple sugar transport system ATP-binding protein
MRIEIAELHRRLKTNFIYVTHDQVEAVTLGQKIVVLKEGRLQQYATPDDVFRRPANLFVAGFIGAPPMNFLRMELVRTGGRYTAVLDTMQIPLPPPLAPRLEGYGKQKIIVGIRPKDLSLTERDDTAEKDDHGTLQAKFLLKECIGDDILYYFDLARDSGIGHPLIVKETQSFTLNRQEAVQIFLNTKDIHLFDPDSGTALITREGNT